MPFPAKQADSTAVWTYFCALAVCLYQFSVAAETIVVAPLVDGWAVWNRIMQFDFGERTWGSYLFDPHGAHPHSIVYLLAWADAHWGGGQQIIQATTSFLAITICVMFLIGRLGSHSNDGSRNLALQVISAVAIASLITSLADRETLRQPFQVVLSVSRLAYLVLLWYLIKALRSGNTTAYAIVVVVSCVAVSFHGTGYLFAGLFAGVNLLLARRWGYAIPALLPTIAAIVHYAMHSSGSGELSQLSSLISTEMAWTFATSLCGYFATPFAYLAPKVGSTPLLVLGFTVMTAIIAITWYCLSRPVASRFGPRGSAQGDTAEFNDDVIYGGVLGLLVLLSAAAAAALMIVRTKAGLTGTSDAYSVVMSTARYTAYSCLAYVLILGALLRMHSRTRRLSPLVPGVFALTATVFAMLPTLDRFSYRLDDELNIAVAAMSMGLSPTAAEAEAIWPDARTDWYWKNALPKTVAYLRSEHLGPWNHLPDLYARGYLRENPVGVERRNVDRTKSDPTGRICRFTADIASSATSLPSRSTLAPVLNHARAVVGYGVLTRRSVNAERRELSGFALCDQLNAPGSRIQIALGNTKWHSNAAIQGTGAPAFNLTDQTWVRGVARNWAGFFLADTPVHRKLFEPGRIIRLANGHLRIVIRQEIASGYLNVFVDGPTMDGNAVGYPLEIDVIPQNPIGQN